MDDTSSEKMFWSWVRVMLSVSSMGRVNGDSSMSGFIFLYWMWKSLNTSFEGEFCGNWMESRRIIRPLSLPKAMTPFLVFSPAEVLNWSVSNPCSFVQFRNVPFRKLKHTSSLSVLIMSSSGCVLGRIQKMLFESNAELFFW